MKFAHILPIWWRQIIRGIGGIPLWWRQLAPDHKGNPLWWRQLAPANRKNMGKFHFALTFLLLRVTKNPWRFILIHYSPLKRPKMGSIEAVSFLVLTTLIVLQTVVEPHTICQSCCHVTQVTQH